MKGKLLPIGSVVLLKDAEEKVMIVGHCAPMQNDKGEVDICDYSGCTYPDGVETVDDIFVFDSKDIQEPLFIGYEDKEVKEESELLEAIDNIYKNIMSDEED